MKNPMSSVRRFEIMVLSLSFVSTTWAIPVVRLEAPTYVNAYQPFNVAVYVDGVNEVDPMFGPDELLAFGFSLGWGGD